MLSHSKSAEFVVLLGAFGVQQPLATLTLATCTASRNMNLGISIEMQLASPHQQSFTWRLLGDTLQLRSHSDARLRSGYGVAATDGWVPYGNAREIGTELRNALPGSDLSWRPTPPLALSKLAARTFNSIGALSCVQEGAEDWIPTVPAALPTDTARYILRYELAAIRFLCNLGESIGHGLPAPKWHACAAEPVWHPQFGPGYACASDGARVVLLASPYFGSDWLMAHARNVRLLPRKSRMTARAEARRAILDSL